MTRHAKREAAVLLLLTVLGTIVFADVLFFGQKLYLRDLTRFYYPTKRIIREVILSGQFPFWNPYYQGGQPMAANPEYAVFYPPQWLILLPSYPLGFDLHIIVHVWLGLAGMYLFLRSLDVRTAAAVFGALSFGVGGLFLSQVNLLPILFCATWMPWILLTVRRAILRPGPRAIALAGLCVGIQLLAAEPTTLVQTWFLIGCYVLYRSWHARRRLATLVTASAVCAAVLAGGGAMGAVQLLPAIEHVHDSVRSRPFDFGLITTWSMPFAKPLELIYPNVFGHIDRHNVMLYWASGMYPNVGSPFIFNYYAGLLTIALILGAFAVRPRGSRLVFLLSAVSALLALGGHTPLFTWLNDWGLARSIRYPEKFAFMGIFALIVFASVMLDRMLRGDERLRAGVSGVVLATTAFALAVAVFSFTPWYASTFATLWGIAPKAANLPTLVSITRVDWIVATLRGGLLFALLWWLGKKGASRLWMAAALAFVFLDLAPVSYEINPRFPSSFFTPPPVARTLPSDRHNYRIFHEADWYGGSDIAKSYFGTGRSVYWIVRNGLFPQTTASWGFRTVLDRDYDKTALLPTVDLVEQMWHVRDSGQKAWAEMFMSMSGARFRSVYRPFEAERKRVGGDFNRAIPVDFQDNGENPIAYFADPIIRVRDQGEFGADLIHHDRGRRLAYVTDLPAFHPAPATVRHIEEKANSVSVDVAATGRSFLVLAVTTHKYWTATIDGRSAPIHVVNVAYQGLEVPAGSHRVLFRYRNTLVVHSLVFSLAAFLILTGTAFFFPPAEVPVGEEPAEEGEGGISLALPPVDREDDGDEEEGFEKGMESP